jgi:hypothetical protein
MEMMVTSESTALTEIKSATRTGRLAPERPLAATEGAPNLSFATRPTTTKIKTGTLMVPNAPSGSRMKTLI